MNRQKQFQIRLQVIQVDDFKCRIVDLSRDYKTGAARLTVETESNIFKAAEELLDKDLTCRLVRFRKRRSLDANAYFWALADELSAKIRISKEDIYRHYIKDVADNYYYLCLQSEAAKAFCEDWESKGLGWMTDTCESKTKGCINIFAYYGSSRYDTAQMSRLLDLIIADCEEQGISTLTPRELAALKQGWSNE